MAISEVNNGRMLAGFMRSGGAREGFGSRSGRFLLFAGISPGRADIGLPFPPGSRDPVRCCTSSEGNGNPEPSDFPGKPSI